MKRIYAINTLFFVLLTHVSLLHANAIDQAWEKRVSEKLAEREEKSEVLWLDAGGQRFLGLYTSQFAEVAHGAAIILHGMGAHADWPQTISPLRTRLPEHGWTSLSIQMPVLSPSNNLEDYGKTLQQAAQRIKASVRLLRERKFLNIVVVAHGFGAVSALSHLSQQQNQGIVALVAVGLHDYVFIKPRLNILDLIENTTIPMLDIYGSRDFDKVIKQAPDRRLAARKGNNQAYDQYEIEGADHHFNRMEDILVKRIRGWLDKAAPGVSIVVDDDFDGNLKEAEEESVLE